MPKPSISVFFPVYNDQATVEPLVTKAKAVLEDVASDWEIILVDDCSQDDTGAIADRLAAEDTRVRVIHHPSNRGYGGALKSGFAAARFGYVFYTDGDGQYDVGELSKLVRYIDRADVVNGYKIRRADRFYRLVLGRIYHATTRFLFQLNVRDVDCDFRLIRRDLLRRLDLESDSGVICVELMAKIRASGARVIEVPVHHYPRVAGSSQFFRPGRILRVLKGLAQQWWKLIVTGGARRRFRVPYIEHHSKKNREPDGP